jgi:uncharacterized protein (DUF1501 family)
MHLTRRDVLRLGLGTSTLLACGTTVPTFLARSAAAVAAEPRKNKDRILVVVQLDGGNDGLNTVVPYRDPDYLKNRTRLRLPEKELHKIDGHIALHPSLADFKKLLEKRQLAIVQSVGYPNPNRSHFESMAIWNTAQMEPLADTPGWLARSLDRKPVIPGGDSPGMHISDAALPHALTGSQRHIPSLANLEQFRRRLGVPEGPAAVEQRAALDQIGSLGRGKPGSLVDFVERSTLITYASSARLEGLMRGQAASADYPGFSLAQHLKLIAQLIKAGLTTSIYYTQLSGFDTHAEQLNTHGFLLRDVSESLKAFVDDMTKSGEGQRVLVLVFSEFGRRLKENGSAGTDHGTAAPLFLLGEPLHGGVYGPYPNLQDLQDGDPKHAIDFRRIYATVLDRWLGCSSMSVLGAKFEHLPLLA